MNTTRSPKSHGTLLALLAAFGSLMLCSCVNLDPALATKKAMLEKKIAQTESAMAGIASDMAGIAVKEALGTATDMDTAELALDTGRMRDATASLAGLVGELVDINHQIAVDKDATRFVNAQIGNVAGINGTDLYNNAHPGSIGSLMLNGPHATMGGTAAIPGPACNNMSPHAR